MLVSSPSPSRCCATLDWAQWALGQAQAGAGGGKASSAQWKASVPLPQLNPQMNSLHCPSHGARRRITRVDSKQRSTVERAEAYALHQLYSEQSHLSFSCLGKWDGDFLFYFILLFFHCYCFCTCVRLRHVRHSLGLSDSLSDWCWLLRLQGDNSL